MKKIILLFFGVGFLVYIQSLFNGFAMDDTSQIIANKQLYGFGNLPSIFVYFWGSYYKPLFYVVLSLLLTIFGDNPFPFHIVQLIFHILNSILVFILFSRFFKKNISIILSLVFLVHPAISEAVLYISAIQDVLYPFFGLLALNLVVYNKRKYTYLVFFLLIFSLLSKETGIAFFVLTLAYKLLFYRDELRKYLIYSTVIVSAYLFIRIGILNINPFSSVFKPIWTYDADLQTRLISMPKIIFKYLALFVWPDKLQVSQLWWVRNINFTNFYFPAAAVIFLLGSTLGFVVLKYKTLKKEIFPYLFFLLFAFLGFLLHSQIIALDFTFAERWFYLPIIGLLGVIGFILDRIKLKGAAKKIFYAFVIILIIFLSTRTFVRSFDWYDNKTLAFHDFEVDRQNPGTYYLLADYYMGNKDYLEAERVYTELLQIAPRNEVLDSPLAFIELFKGNTDKAEEILRNSPKTTLSNRINYAYLLLRIDPKKGREFLKGSLEHFPTSYEVNLLLGLTEYRLGNYDEAIKYISRAIKLNPAKADEYQRMLNAINNSTPINLNFKL